MSNLLIKLVKASKALALSFFLLGTDTILIVYAHATPLEQLYPKLFKASDSVLCGPTPDATKCPPEYGLIKLFNTPIGSVHEDGTSYKWRDSLPWNVDATPEQELLLYIVAQLQVYGIIFRDIEEYNTTVKNEEKDEWCKQNYRYPTFQEGLHRAPHYESFLVGDLSTEDRQHLELCKANQFSTFADFPDSGTGKRITSLYRLLNHAFESEENLKLLQKLFFLLQAQGTDLSLWSITKMLEGYADPDYLADVFHPEETTEHLGYMESSKGLEPGGDYFSGITNKAFTYDGEFKNFDDEAYEKVEQLGFRKKASFMFADKFYFKNHSELILAQARNTGSLVDADGADVVIVANKIIIGADKKDNVAEDGDIFGGLLSYPNGMIVSLAGRPVLKKTDGTAERKFGRAGTVFMLSPNFELGSEVLRGMRSSFNRYEKQLTNNGKTPFIVDEPLAVAAIDAFDKKNMFANEIRSAAKSPMPIEAFIPLWESALQWEIQNNPKAVLHHFLYVAPEELSFLEGTRTMDTGFNPGGKRPQGIIAFNTYGNNFIPDSVMDSWLLSSLQDIRTELNRARVKKDQLGIIDQLRKLESVSSGFFPISSAAVDKYNDQIEHLLEERKKEDALFTYREIDLLSDYGPSLKGLVITSASTLESQLIPTRLLLKTFINGDEKYMARIFYTEDKGGFLTFKFGLKLVSDERIRARAKEFLRADGGALMGELTDWNIVAQPPDYPYVKGFRYVMVSADSVDVEIDVAPEDANELLWSLAMEPGFPITISWSLSATPSVHGAFLSYISVNRGDSVPLKISGNTILNYSKDSYILEYMSVGRDRLEEVPDLLLRAGQSTVVDILPTMTSSNSAILPSGVRKKNLTPFSVNTTYYIATEIPIVKNISIVNKIASTDGAYGDLKYVELSLSNNSSKIPKANFNMGPVRLAPAGAVGSEVKLNIIKQTDSDEILTISGVAIYSGGSVVTIKPFETTSKSIYIDYSMLSK